MNFWYFVLTVLLPGIVAAVVTYFLNKKYETERRKRNVLSDLMAFRNAITERSTDYDTQQFFPVMNRIIIEFDDPDINSLLRTFRTEQNTEKKTALLSDIIQLLIQKVGVKHLKQNDELIKHPFSSS